MNNIEKIKAEIERLMKETDDSQFGIGGRCMCRIILDFIDSMSEEKPSEELEKAAQEYADKHGFRVPYDGSNNYYDDVDVNASKEGFKAGAEWMAKQGVTFTAAVDHYEDFYLDSCDQEAEAIKKLGLKVIDWAIVQIRKKWMR